MSLDSDVVAHLARYPEPKSAETIAADMGLSVSAVRRSLARLVGYGEVVTVDPLYCLPGNAA